MNIARSKVLLVFLLVVFSSSLVSSQLAPQDPTELGPAESAFQDCFLNNRHNVHVDFQVVGYVSTQGHYADNLSSSNINYYYGLFCSDFLVTDRTDGTPTFYFSEQGKSYTVNGNAVLGGGHISQHNSTEGPMVFEEKALHGFAGNNCRFTDGACEINEVCVLRVSDPDHGTVADCNDNTLPYQHNFQHRICCRPTEYCRDGIDNTGDGLIDCQSPECHPSPINMEPQRCDPGTYNPGNFQSTSECVIGYNDDDTTIYNEDNHCLGVSDDPSLEPGWTALNIANWPAGFPDLYDYPDVRSPYHCSYGFRDDGTATNNTGFCCPPDTIAEIHPVTGAVSCQPFSECGVGTDFICLHDHRINFVPDWITYYYSDDPDDWCVSKVGDYFNPINFSTEYTSSMGCCFVSMYGKFGFYHNDKNVKIFGYE